MQISQDDQGKTPCAVWLRVSTDHQETANQEPDIARLIAHRGMTEVTRYTVSDSASHPGTDYRDAVRQMLADGHAGKWSVLVIWAADRLTRLGIEDLLSIVRRLRESGCTLISVQEPWLSGDPHTAELLAAISAWIAAQESRRRSERIRAGLARRKDDGKPVGRVAGAKDRRKRRTRGYEGNQNAVRKAADE